MKTKTTVKPTPKQKSVKTIKKARTRKRKLYQDGVMGDKELMERIFSDFKQLSLPAKIDTTYALRKLSVVDADNQHKEMCKTMDEIANFIKSNS